MEGNDCSDDNHGCSTGLVCALDIVDENDENQMSLCISADRCGIDDVYESEEFAINFIITPATECVHSWADNAPSISEGYDCSEDRNGCSAG